ncbi:MULTISPECIES: iron uptake porin [Trichocoleus]|uniref:Iron uptake porin n=1 Tax=Trichocoleus desertorum GB2-A4 TaxID=2933944 RepID=A0ABV0J347_9CYAN|nr:iron uptake porin [Trichocoleus sp. FACHB-46]MBD1861538.1 iron uptake porin [Trichocoleus sp. FACHB-46]
MSKILWKSLLVSPALLGTVLAVSSGAIAAEAGVVAEAAQPQVTAAQDLAPVAVSAQPAAPEAEVSPVFATVPSQAQAPTQIAQVPANTSSLDQVNKYTNEGKQNSVAQVTSVSQLSDVQPTDWAFQALQSLVERYGCIAGYPDGTYRGNRAMTRYEFAAGLNSCMDRVNELIAAGTADLVTKEDLATLQRLQEEFSAELATLRGRVDALEARTAELEANQFSTTTKLVGEAIFAVTDEFNQSVSNNPVLQDRVRLDLQSSFTGRDVLHTRLAAGNATGFSSDLDTNGLVEAVTAEGTQQFNIGNTGNNDIVLDWLSYYFPLGDNINVYLAGTGGIHSDYVYSTTNPYLEDYDGGNGALSAFGQESPIYRIGGGAGVGINTKFGDAIALSLGYLGGPDAANPSEKNGLFDGNYAALGQLTFSPGDNLELGLTYVHGYHNTGTPIFNLGSATQTVTGNALANGGGSDGGPRVTNSYGAQASFKVSNALAINGFFGYTNVINLQENSRDVWYYGLGLALPDFGKKGNLLGLVAGVEPYLGSKNNDVEDDTSLHLEGFYKYQLNDNISVTPGVIWITAPGQNEANDDILIGTVRTTFKF